MGDSLLAAGELCRCRIHAMDAGRLPRPYGASSASTSDGPAAKRGGNTLEGGLVLAITYGVMLLCVMNMALRRSKRERQLNALDDSE